MRDWSSERMRAIYAAAINVDDPLRGLAIGEVPQPEVPADWVPVKVQAASLNHHELWLLRGVGLRPNQLPMILGCDAAGLDPNGNEVIVHSVIGDRPAGGGDETLDPDRTLLSERYPGTFAEYVWVPASNLLPKPAGLSMVEAACLPTSWLTAYRMLMTRGRLPMGGSVLVQGATGGVGTAAVLLARVLGARIYATSRQQRKRDRLAELGATPIEPGGRLPERVDVVIETVGMATIDHSIKCAKPGGRIVVTGATSGNLATIDLRRVFFRQLELIGSTMGTRAELASLLRLFMESGLRPIIDSVYSFTEARAAFARLASGEAFGKIVLDLSQ